MRMSIPGYNVLVQPLTEIMEKVCAAVGGKRDKQAVSTVLLSSVGWNTDHLCCLERTKEAQSHVVELSHPDPDKQICVFADASEKHWGSVITQIPMEDQSRPLAAQRHEPLMFLSGTFSGAASRWAIVEKEAYAIVETLVRADYLLHPPEGFNLYTDHRNLKYIFNPTAVVSAVPKYTAAKLERWALLLMGYHYVIHDIPGEANVWADVLSRWGSSLPSICAIVRRPLLVSPLMSGQFVWPSLAAIAEVQILYYRDYQGEQGLETSLGQEYCVRLKTGEVWQMRLLNGKIWIPDDATDLQLRLCVCAHSSLFGHRTLEFTRLIHWDFLSMGKSNTNDRYLLVIKCDASKLVWLFPTPEATATFVKHCLLQWFAVFGICYDWVSDQGTHFKNQVIAELQHSLGAHHHFTTARCPWADVTVEVVMRQILRLFRSCLSEWKMSTLQWPEIVLVIMLILNQLPSPSLGNVSSVTAMSGRPAMSLSDTISIPGSLKSISLEEVAERQEKSIEAVQIAMDQMHKEMALINAKKRDRARQLREKKHGVQMANFVGDFVLYQDVWAHRREKLRTKWCGPAEINKVVV
ncbi:hypothetical protein Ae201684_018961 [Aphanomyces euteiches]|uniref:Integrase catalytic domain-containing protein n=1 Tax=Aphanomyces euteiches TaxID=100861 RepID=A0A6G0W3Z1_9STRA|nr:hypothetical protein Ae201684_018961 [Aphanomyces euteiches]